MLPPKAPGRMTSWFSAPAGQTPIVPKERLDWDSDVVADEGMFAVREVEDVEVRIREVGGEEAGLGDDGAPAPVHCPQFENLDGERVAEFRAGDLDRTSERVDAVPVERLDVGGGRVGRELVVGGIAGFEDDGVTAIDDDLGSFRWSHLK